ncbi:protease complex subunit PrcB family protein [Lachnospiraceae bacterium 47-T17]
MKKLKVMLAVLLGVCLLAGCGIEEQEAQKQADLEYTLVAPEDIPPELLTQIEDAMTEEMKLTYADDGCFYLVKGYGEQPAGSSIQVLELYRTKDGIVFDTQLLGGGAGTAQDTTSAYPYIVVKLLCDEQNVVFR